MVIHWMLPEERPQVEELAKTYKETRDMPYCWTRWKNWERHPPIVVVDQVVIGFHALTFSRQSLYVNSYFQAVSTPGNGIGGLMVDFLLGEFMPARIKFKTPNDKESPGYVFWSGFGLQPFATNGKEYFWDEDIWQANSVGQLIEKMKNRENHFPIPIGSMNRYKKAKGFQLL